MSKGYDLQLGKETWKQLENIHKFGYSNSSIFNDFVDVCLYSLLSLTDNMKFPDIVERLKENKLTGEYEAEYMKIVEKYKENKTREKGDRPADYFKEAWGSLIKEAWESQQDVLGEIYQAKISFGEHGQFFTPSNISDLMSQIVTMGEIKKTLHDPACGSGRFFISYGKVNKDVLCYGVDLSLICAKMTALNMWLFDLNADIFHGDSLSMKMYQVWKIRKGGYIYESTDEAIMPKPAIIAIKKQAEQQQLFKA